MGKKTRSKTYDSPFIDDKSKYDDLLEKYNELERQFLSLRNENETLRGQIQSLSDNDDSNAHSRTAACVQIVSKDNIPLFEAKVPASDPLRRNAEVESFLKRVELVTQSSDDSMLISVAKSRCRGAAELLINSSLFDSINTWSDFKDLVRIKFRGTTTPADYFTFLNALQLGTSQSPQDLYIQIQGYVYQGARDYPNIIVDTEELISRIFLQALPLWLRELLASAEDLPIDKLVDVSSRIWNCRVKKNSSFSESVATTSHSDKRDYCAYHKFNGHSTSACRKKPSGNVCWKCQGHGHKRNNCPFSSSQASGIDTQTAGGQNA